MFCLPVGINIQCQIYGGLIFFCDGQQLEFVPGVLEMEFWVQICAAFLL